MPTTVSVDVYAHDRASATFDRVGNSAHRSGGLVGKFGATVLGVFTGAALWNGAERLTRGLVDLGAAAIEDQKAASVLALQLHNSANATDAQVAATESWITAQGKALGMADDQLRPALTRAATATHNIAKAQDLVSLAMDVSTGKGKDLQSVVEALSRGEDGNTAALGRLGVKTKDAAGEAKSFDQITQDLARTFHGQAATAADTTAGQFERLHVQFAETGEAIGYKLLPFANDFGQWALSEGVPAAEQLGHWLADELGPSVQDLGDWFRENKDELQDFATTAMDTAVPAVRGLASVAGDLLGFVSDLPGPVQKLGAEVGAAAFIMPKLTGAIGGLNLPAFGGQLRNAETRTAALSKAARAAAGVGGMVALAEGAQNAGTKLGFLETAAGGAMTGFAVGGPWGAAIGAGAGALLGLDQAARHTNQAIQDAVTFNADYIDSLDQVTGAVTKLTKETIYKNFTNDDTFTFSRAYGLPDRDVVNAARGNVEAFERLRKRLAVAVAGGTLDKTFMSDFLHSLAAENREIDDGTAIVQRRQSATEGWGKALKGLPERVQVRLENLDYAPTLSQIDHLNEKYDLTPKQLRTLITATGTAQSAAAIQEVLTKLSQLHDKTVTVTYAHRGSPGAPSAADVAGGGAGRIGGGYRGRGSSSFGSAFLNDAGAGLLSSLVAGITKGAKPLDTILEKVRTNVQTKLDFRDQLQGMHDQFAAGFDWRESVFGMHSGEDTGPLTVQQILAKAGQQRAQAGQVDVDVQKLLSMGISEDLIRQMQSQGADGIETLHTLASASQDQINELIADNQAAQASYNHVGQITADRIYSAQIAAADQNAAVALQVQAAVESLKDWGDKLRFEIRGDALVAVLARQAKNHPDH